MHKLFLPLGILLVSLGATAEETRCVRDSDLARFSRGAQHVLRCAERSHARATPVCAAPGVPACARNALAEILALVQGAAPVPDSNVSDARRCQSAIGLASADYIGRRVKERLGGQRSASRTSLLRDVVDTCDGVAIEAIGSGRLPAVAGPCEPLLTGRATIDGDALGRCLSAAIEGVLDRVSPTPLPPNVVIIYTDDQRWDTLAFMPKTLDRLADRGVVFENAFVSTPVCGPSRASLLTGRYAHAHGIRTNQGLIQPNDFDEDDTIGRWLQAARYRTAFLGKYVNGTEERPPAAPRGWSEWQTFRVARYYDYELDVDGSIEAFGSEAQDYSTDVLTERALAFIDRHREEPFFVVLSLFAPHAPSQPAERHAGGLAGLPPSRPANFRESNLSGKPGWIRFHRGIAGPEAAIDAFRIQQLESLGAVDDAVEQISDRLDAHGLTDNTVVVFTSDNGYHWGEHWWNSKFTGYEESLRVPLVVRHPAAQPLASTSDALVLNIDLAPTFAELGGAAPASNVDGRSLVPVLRGEAWQRSDFLFEIFDTFLVRPHAGIRTASHKYIETGDRAFEELYGLAADPHELENHASTPAWRGVLDALRGRLSELRR